MKYLLDTIAWLWSVGPLENIAPQALEILKSPKQELYFSTASVWEIVIKTQLGKCKLPESPGSYVPKRLSEQGIRTLPITLAHALAVGALPRHHRDPFDRLIIAQAIAEEMTILTADRVFERYPVEVVWCGK